MIIQEPVQAAIWHCLNHYNYSDAIFLGERLYAELKTEESLFLLCTAYYRNGQKDHAYFILKFKLGLSSQCKYLFGICAYDLGKYAEAEAVLLDNLGKNQIDDIITEYGNQAPFVLLLLGKIALKTERRNRAIEFWKKSLKLNPFLWSSYEYLCKIGDKPNPQNIFSLNGLENLSMCHGNGFNNIESAIISNVVQNDNQESLKECIGFIFKTPQQMLTNFNSTNIQYSNAKYMNSCTPEESPLANNLNLSGIAPINSSVPKLFRLKLESNVMSSPSFGHLFDQNSDIMNNVTPGNIQTLNENCPMVPKKIKAQLFDNVRKEAILQSTKPPLNLNNQCITLSLPKTPTLNTSGQNVRRSSRLFSNSYSVKENNKSPTRNKFATPKSPTKKSKQSSKLNKNITLNKKKFTEMNTRNLIEKEKSETITSITGQEEDKMGNENLAHKALTIQKHSAEGLMSLLKVLGEAFLELSSYECDLAIQTLNTLPPNHFETTWVQCMLGLAYFELAQYENCIKYFNEVHTREPFHVKYMDIYSTALWHRQKEVLLSTLAQDLVKADRYSPITWCVNGNCFSLHKEHDTAIKFFQRAVQIDPDFPYAYTLLGHEYITTEELDKAMNCFRNAICLDPRHYNAWFGIGTIYSKQERYQLAELNYSRALQINPRSSVILCHIGMVQHALKESEKALFTFNNAVLNDPKSSLCKFHRSSIYFALGRHAEALKELEELKQIVPKESLVYYLIGKVHKKLGNTDLALMHFSWATDLDPKGASNQIKEAFDPAINDESNAAEEPSSSPNYLSFVNHLDRNSFNEIHEDSSNESF